MNPHFREVAKACFPKALLLSRTGIHVIRQVYWAMERVRKNEQNKLSVQIPQILQKIQMSSDETNGKTLGRRSWSELALMFEIAPRLADAYRLKNEFLDVIRAESSAAGKPKLDRLADGLLKTMGLARILLTAPKHIATGSAKS